MKYKKKFLDYIIVPMAGIGSRYKKSNFKTIKPLILVDKQSILEKSLNDLPDATNKYILVNKKIYSKYPKLEKIINARRYKKILLNKPTLGQADTVYKSKKILDHKKNALIHSCDYILKFSINDFKKIAKKNDVVIFVYKMKSRNVNNYNDYAYCKFNFKNSRVTKIVEKKTITKTPWNDLMIVGTFWFKEIGIFYKSQRLAFKKKETVLNEYYIANNINNLIKRNYKVSFLEVNEWINLGDYFDYQQYLYWSNFFSYNKNLLKC